MNRVNRSIAAAVLALAGASTGPAVRAESLYEHPDGYFAIDRPEGWSVDLSYNGMEFQAVFRGPETDPVDPVTAFRVLFLPLGLSADVQELSGAIEGLTSEVADTLLAPSARGTVVSRKSVEVAGRKAHRLEVEQTNDAGRRLVGAVVGTVGRSAIFFFIFYSPAEEWEARRSIFEKMLASFADRNAVIADEMPSDSYQDYRDPAGVFRVRIPDNWIPQLTREESGLRHHFLPKRAIQEGADAKLLISIQHFEVPVEGEPLGQTVRGLVRQMLASTPNLEKLGEEEARIGEVRAILVRYRLGGDKGAFLEDVHYLRAGRRVFVVMAAAPEPLHPVYRETFRRIAGSLVIE